MFKVFSDDSMEENSNSLAVNFFHDEIEEHGDSLQDDYSTDED